MSDPFRPSRRSAATILLVALVWLVAAAAVTISAEVDVGGLDGFALARFIAGLALRLAPPLAVTIVALELVRRAGRGDAAIITELEARTVAAATAGQAVRDGLLDIDATLTAIGGRLADLRAATASEAPRLTEAATTIGALTTTLAATAATTATTARDLAAVVPLAQRHANALASTLAATGDAATRQLGEVETMLAGVMTRQTEVAAQVAAIGAATTAAAAAIDARAANLDTAVDAALTRTAAAVVQVRDAVDAQAATMVASIGAAQTGLDLIGGATAATVAARIDHIVAATHALGASLADHDAATHTLIATVERSFAILDKRLGHATAMGTATLDGFHTRMAAVRDLADGVPARLDAAVAGLDAVHAAAARLAPAAAGAEDLHRALAVAAAPATAVADDFARARADLAAIEEAAHGTALAAANQLIEVLGRVREVAHTATGTLRDALAAVVAEAEAALTEAGHRTATAAFADPIRHEIAGLEGATALAADAAQATADRIAARLLGLTATVATVERRLAGVER